MLVERNIGVNLSEFGLYKLDWKVCMRLSIVLDNLFIDNAFTEFYETRDEFHCHCNSFEFDIAVR